LDQLVRRMRAGGEKIGVGSRGEEGNIDEGKPGPAASEIPVERGGERHPQAPERKNDFTGETGPWVL